jgi:hypothetical protein
MLTFAKNLTGRRSISLRMEGDILKVTETTPMGVGPICSDSTILLVKQWNYSKDSALYHGSGFWFQEVLQYFRQHDSFGFERHNANPRPDKIASESMMLGLLLFEIFLVAFLLKRGLKLIGQYTRISFTPTDRVATYSETSQIAGFSQFLWILTLIVFSLMGHLLVNNGSGNTNYGLGSLYMLYLLLYTFCFFFLQNFLYRLIGTIFFNPLQTNRWIANNKTILFYYAMALTPVLIGAEIGAIPNNSFVFFWTLLFFIVIKIWMFLKTIRIFSIGISDFLYLILYLCTLEILPILLYYRGLFLL